MYESCICTFTFFEVGATRSLYMIHWPGVAGKKPDDEGNAAVRLETWAELQKLHTEGKCRVLGVSNYLPHHLEELCSWEGCTVRPAGEFCTCSIRPRQLRGLCLHRPKSIVPARGARQRPFAFTAQGPLPARGARFTCSLSSGLFRFVDGTWSNASPCSKVLDACV